MGMYVTIRNRLYLAFRDFSLLGPKQALRYYAARLWRFLHHPHGPFIPFPLQSSIPLDQNFDQRFSVDTNQSSIPDDRCIGSASQKWGLHYVPTPENLFQRMLHHVQADLRDYVFVDFGAGKGRVLLMASEYPFKRILGVEYSEPLVAIGQKNIRAYHSQTQRCRDVSYLCADVSEVILPAEPIVLYCYNAFQGKVMDRVIRNVKHSLRRHPRDLWIVYFTPWEHRKFKRIPSVRIIESNWQFCVYRLPRRAQDFRGQTAAA